MSHPTVNLNGTSQRELVDQACAVINKLADLRGALARAAPHGWDYQITKNGTYLEARAAHERQDQFLYDMRNFWEHRVELLEEGGK